MDKRTSRAGAEKKVARELLRVARYVLASERVSFRYQDIGHGAGSVIWWVDNQGKVQTFVSTGKEFHHDLNRRMDMDARWRGRLEKDSKVVTMIPPYRLYKNEVEEIPFPDDVMNVLEHMGGRTFLVDTPMGLRRVAKTERRSR